jgi:hypothetical protein
LTTPADDPTSLGAILLSMGVLNEDQLDELIDMQERATLENLLGKLAIAEGLISAGQLEEALSAQEGLRSKSKHRRALAAVELSERATATVTSIAAKLKTTISAERRRRTGDRHPAITPGMLAAKAADE